MCLIRHRHAMSPTPVTFTDDGRAKSHLPPNVLKSLRREFDKVARISVTSPKAPQESSPLRFFPLRVIMRCDLGMFFRWYSQISSSHNHRLLPFELDDVTCQNERGFIISEYQPDSFRLLKQYIWDMFWIESRIRGSLKAFTVTVEPYLPVSNSFSQQEDRSPYTPISPPTTNQSPPVGRTNETTAPSQLPEAKLSNTSAQAPPLLRSSAEKITLRMVSLCTVRYFLASTLLDC